MDVLNFAHGALLAIGAYAAWWAADNGLGYPLAVLIGTAAGTTPPPCCWSSA